MKIILNHVSKKIKKNQILKDISLQMESGKVYGLQGINGSGKTMLMRMLLGLMYPTEGSVSIDGKILGQELEFPKSVGFLIENPAFLGRYTGFGNLKLLSELSCHCSDGELHELINKVGIENDKKYRKYSLGMKQKLGIAAAVMGDPSLIILDEPTNALDREGMIMLINLIAEQRMRGALIVVASHDTHFLEEISDELFVMDTGVIIQRKKLQQRNSVEARAYC